MTTFAVTNRNDNTFRCIEATSHEQAVLVAAQRDYRRKGLHVQRVTGTVGLSGVFAVYQHGNNISSRGYHATAS